MNVGVCYTVLSWNTSVPFKISFLPIAENILRIETKINQDYGPRERL